MRKVRVHMHGFSRNGNSTRKAEQLLRIFSTASRPTARALELHRASTQPDKGDLPLPELLNILEGSHRRSPDIGRASAPALGTHSDLAYWTLADCVLWSSTCRWPAALAKHVIFYQPFNCLDQVAMQDPTRSRGASVYRSAHLHGRQSGQREWHGRSTGCARPCRRTPASR